MTVTQDKKSPRYRMEYWLKKIYLLERLKGRYVAKFDFTKYKRACQLQEKIVLQIRIPDYEQKLQEEKTEKNRFLAQNIRKQAEINQALLDDLKNISQEYLEPLGVVYYDQKGNVKKLAKTFTADI